MTAHHSENHLKNGDNNRNHEKPAAIDCFSDDRTPFDFDLDLNFDENYVLIEHNLLGDKSKETEERHPDDDSSSSGKHIILNNRLTTVYFFCVRLLIVFDYSNSLLIIIDSSDDEDEDPQKNVKVGKGNFLSNFSKCCCDLCRKHSFYVHTD